MPDDIERPGWKLVKDKETNLKCSGRMQRYNPVYLEDGPLTNNDKTRVKIVSLFHSAPFHYLYIFTIAFSFIFLQKLIDMRHWHLLCEILLAACSSLSAWITAQPCKNVETQKLTLQKKGNWMQGETIWKIIQMKTKWWPTSVSKIIKWMFCSCPIERCMTFSFSTHWSLSLWSARCSRRNSSQKPPFSNCLGSL